MYVCNKCDRLFDDSNWEDGLARKEAEAVCDQFIQDLCHIKQPPNDEHFQRMFREGCLNRVIDLCKNICDDCFIAASAEQPLQVALVLPMLEQATEEHTLMLAQLTMLLPAGMRDEIEETLYKGIPVKASAQLARLSGRNQGRAGLALLDEVKRLVERANLPDTQISDEGRALLDEVIKAADDVKQAIENGDLDDENDQPS